MNRIVLVLCLFNIFDVLLLDAKVLPASMDVGVRAMPAQESKEMTAFKRGLRHDDRSLLQTHNSKTRFIEGVLTGKRDADGRDQEVQDPDVEEATLIHNAEVQKFIATLPADIQQLIKDNPSKADSLLDALHEVQRPESDGAEVPSSDSSEVDKRELNEENFQQKLQDMMTHISALQEIVEQATKQRDGPTDSLKELTDRIAADITLAKEKGIKIEDILNSLKTRGMKKKSSA